MEYASLEIYTCCDDLYSVDSLTDKLPEIKALSVNVSTLLYLSE